MRRAVFLDRDGVLNVNHGYVGSVDRLELVPGAGEAVARLNALGYFVAVVTNQSGIGRGFFTEEDHETVMRALGERLAASGGHIDDSRFCPFHPEATVARYREANHPWRKPNPGMILDLMAAHDLGTEGSFLIGDSAGDIEAARAASIPAYLFEGGRPGTASPERLDAFLERIL